MLRGRIEPCRQAGTRDTIILVSHILHYQTTLLHQFTICLMRIAFEPTERRSLTAYRPNESTIDVPL